MASRLDPYLDVHGQAREAPHICGLVLSGDVDISRSGDRGDPRPWLVDITSG